MLFPADTLNPRWVGTFLALGHSSTPLQTAFPSGCLSKVRKDGSCFVHLPDILRDVYSTAVRSNSCAARTVAPFDLCLLVLKITLRVICLCAGSRFLVSFTLCSA